MWNLVSFHLETLFVSVEDRRLVCARRTVGSVVILDAPMELPGDEAQVEAHFGLFGDSANLDAR